MEKSQSEVVSPTVAIVAVALTFVFAIFLAAAITALFGESVALVVGELSLLVLPLAYMLLKKIDVARYIQFGLKPKTVAWGLLWGGVLFLVDVAMSIVLVSLFGLSQAVEESNKLVLNLSSSQQGLIMVIISLLLAGICEEFVFRGFLQTAIRSRYSLGIALLVSSAAFGLFHFDPQGVYTISAFSMGLLLGYVYHKWHSYVVSAVAHVTLNLIALLIMLSIR